MAYVPPFWAIEEEVIPEVANFKEEGLVTPDQVWQKRVGRVGIRPSGFWQNRRRRRATAARRITTCPPSQF